MAYKSSLEEIRHKHVNRGRAAVAAGCAILVLSASLVFSGCKNEEQKSDVSADNVAAMSPICVRSRPRYGFRAGRLDL